MRMGYLKARLSFSRPELLMLLIGVLIAGAIGLLVAGFDAPKTM